MDRRTRILKTINHEQPDRIPIGFDMEQNLQEKVLKHYGVKELWQLYDKTGIDCFSVWTWTVGQPYYTGPRCDDSPAVKGSQATYTCWGKYGEDRYPLSNCSIDDYLWPDTDHFDFSNLKKDLANIRQFDITAASGHAGCGFQHHVEMSSYDKIFYELMDDVWMDEYMARTREFFVSYFTKLFENAGGLIDIIRADEDIGSQDRLLLNPDLWRRWYKPLWKEVFDICKKNGAKVWLHSCGYCRPVIEDFIEIGVDILNPIPVYVKDSDPLDMKQTFGDRLCFDGGVNQIGVIVSGSPKQVREEVKLRIEQMAPGGGYIIGPSQVFSEDVPAENIYAFFDAALEFGSY